MGTINVYTDGSCLGNPGSGGWAVIFNLKEGLKKISGNASPTTNNRMELIAVLEALKEIDRLRRESKDAYVIYSDSAYVVNAINNGWLKKWRKNGWLTSKGEEIKNKSLWCKVYVKLSILSDAGIVVQIRKVKGHSGNTFNELADKFAREKSLEISIKNNGE